MKPVDPRQAHFTIIRSLRNYFASAGATQAVVAMSGGIDSAVVLALAVEALGPGNVRALMLPSRYSSGHSVDDSVEMNRRLGIRGDIAGIEPVFAAALAALGPVLDGTPHCALAEENIQSRIRCMMTMALANATGALMLNTSNKSEIMVGYGTLYGDTSGALSVIGGLYKTEVYALAREINDNGLETPNGILRQPIPQPIVDKAPSAELRPGQFDHQSLPEYDLLDPILYELVENGVPAAELAARGTFPAATVEKVARLHAGSAFKRAQLPPAIPIERE